MSLTHELIMSRKWQNYGIVLKLLKLIKENRDSCNYRRSKCNFTKTLGAKVISWHFEKISLLTIKKPQIGKSHQSFSISLRTPRMWSQIVCYSTPSIPKSHPTENTQHALFFFFLFGGCWLWRSFQSRSNNKTGQFIFYRVNGRLIHKASKIQNPVGQIKSEAWE